MNKAELIKKIQEANTAYAAGIPFITDAEYDILWQELYKIDPNNSILYHTARNVPGVSGAITHRYPIYGTSKAFSAEELQPFLMRHGSRNLVIEPKYDGCAAVLELTSSGWQLALEGDGLRGADISHLLPYIHCPFETRHFQSIEIIIPWKYWDPSYGKNPRNVVSGWTNPLRKTPPPGEMVAVPHNFGPVSHEYFYDGSLENLNELLLSLHTLWKEVYPIDGLMIKVASEKERIIIGTDGPRNAWSIAWKPPIQTASTIVTDIEWNVSRLGRIIPTVIYNPIELCGTTNQRVTGNNAQWIKERHIVVGSTLLVGKAGEIIPKILRVSNENTGGQPAAGENVQNTSQNSPFPGGLDNPGSTPHTAPDGPKNPGFNVPRYCPICRSELIWEGVHLICKADNCIAKLIVSLSYFYSAKGIKLDGIGDATIEKILQHPKGYEVLRTSPWAILDMLTYDLIPTVSSILGEKVFENLYTQVVNASGTKTMAHFISGLGLPGVAYKTALRLCQFLKSGKLNIPISETAKNSFIKAVSIYNQAQNEMLNFHFAPIPSPAKAIFCVTGTLSVSREAFVEHMADLGYEFSSSVTRETNYLIVGTEPGKVKTTKADKYNIPQITEEQFNKLIEGD